MWGFVRVCLACSIALVACGDDGNVNPLPDAPPPNIPPEVTITARDFQSVVGRVVTLRAEGTDPDGDALTFTWTQTEGPAITLLNPESATPSYVARQVGIYKFTVSASDGQRTTPPVEVKVSVFDLDGGEDHTLALKPDGTLLSWGSNSDGQLGDPRVGGERRFVGPVCEPGTKCTLPFTGVVAIAAGRAHSLALKADGTVWAWGDHSVGQLGVGFQKINGSFEPLQVCNVGANDCTKDPLTGVVAIAAGFQFSAALKADGTVVTWGLNQDGQLGNGQFDDAFSPVRVCAVGDELVFPSAAFGVGGPVECTAFLDDVVQLTAGGGGHAIAIRGDGTVVAWGHNKAGQVGIGDSIALNDVRVPKQVCAVGQTAPCTAFLADVVSVDAWSGHSLALTSDGSVLAWGSNDDSELGAVTSEICDNGDNCTSVPVPVCTTNDTPCTTPLAGVAQIAAGRRFSVALTNDNQVLTWGDNAFGQQGDGGVETRVSPGPVCAFAADTPCTAFFDGAGAVAAGSFHGLVLRDDGLLFTWGDNDFGQLGNNDLTPTATVPVVVGGF